MACSFPSNAHTAQAMRDTPDRNADGRSCCSKHLRTLDRSTTTAPDMADLLVLDRIATVATLATNCTLLQIHCQNSAEQQASPTLALQHLTTARQLGQLVTRLHHSIRNMQLASGISLTDTTPPFRT